MNPPPPDTSTALQPFEPAPDAVYSIEVVAHLTRTPRHRIAVYCRHGLISPLAAPEDAGWIFDDEAIRTLRLVEDLRSSYGVNLSGLRLISELLRDLEELRREVRFLRGH
jgi:DNA-binding transcriptional MerR regulator